MNKKKRKHSDIIENGKGLIEFYRENPCIAAYELLGVDLSPIQRSMFEDFWFKNYVIGVCGRGAGKSIDISSLAHIKDKGLIYLHEELPPIPFYLRDGEEEIINYDESVYTSEGFKNTKRLCLEKGIIGKKLTTQNGLVNKGSNHHPLLTLDLDDNFVYKSMDEFVVGDRVCVQRGQNAFGNNEIPIDDSYIIGLFIGDGTLLKKYTPSITTEDEEIKKFCEVYCTNNNISYRVDKDKRTKNTVNIYFKQFDWFFEKYRVERTLSYGKSVPYSIRTATKDVQVAFLQGYFDADGAVDRAVGGASCCSVSKKLLKEIQIMLLNFGIVAHLREKKTNSKFGRAYLLDMTSIDSYKFKELIGSRLKRKQDILENYFEVKKLNPNKDTIPYILQTCALVAKYYYTTYRTLKKPSLKIVTDNKKELTYDRLHRFLIQCAAVEHAGFSLNKYTKSINKLKYILMKNYFFDTVKLIEDWKGDCYDFEMDMGGQPNYFVNGFINHNTFMLGLVATLGCMLISGYRVGLISGVFRQSKMIFAEVEKLYAQSPILREATDKPPTRGSDVCYLRFKSIGGKPPSYIEALPLGADGSKIRGSRFYLILIDELAQIPTKIIDMVLRPMGATALAPMERVRRLEQKNRLISLGLATDADFEEETVNKMIMVSSGYYKFNHMWKRMKDHWRQMDIAEKEGKECQYAVWQIPHWDLPDGFLDKNNIDEAKRIMSNAEFSMEYEASMTSDSEGFFKASLLDTCSIDSGFTVETRPDSKSKYILGVDPNQGGRASCGIIVIKIGSVNKIVQVLEVKTQTTQELTKIIQGICEKRNILRVFMDKGGGGKAICDLLEEGYGGKTPLIDRTNDDHRHLEGSHILELVYFNPAWISDANFATKSMLEDKKLLFPEPPTGSTLDSDAKSYDVVERLKSQMLSIVVTQTSTGVLHFDTPVRGQKKDLYSALLLAVYGARIVEKELEGEGEPLLFSAGGLVMQHGIPGASFDPILARQGSSGNNVVSAALLKKKIK